MDYTAGALFIAIAVPILFFIAVWVAVIVYRLYYPEKSLPFISDDPANTEQLKKRLGSNDPVSYRDIRLRIRQKEATKLSGEAGAGESDVLDRLPGSWRDELWDRRN